MVNDLLEVNFPLPAALQHPWSAHRLRPEQQGLRWRMIVSLRQVKSRRANMISARIAMCAAIFLLPDHATSREKADVLIRHVSVVEVEQARIRSGQAVATKGDRVVAVGKDAEIAAAWEAVRQVDGKGRFLIPGLWDMHVHFGGGAELVEENKALLPLYIAYGITTIRDCSGDLANDVLNWRQEIAA